MNGVAKAVLAGVMALAFASPAFAQSADRFPRPEFQSSYQEPSNEKDKKTPRTVVMEWVDVFVLLAALSAAAYYSLKRVSRKAIFILSVAAVLYFGFYREGCVCPIGSIQNVAQGIGGTSYGFTEKPYVLPLTVVLFFLLPLIFALFFGRVFCASVCPLGAAQEMVIIKPIKVPKGVKHFLSLIPYVYLGTGVLLAYVGADYIICKYDPFIGFFRMGANFGMFVFSGAILLIGTVVARPYCRFMCPYSILLKWTSVLSRWHLKTTPTECIQCRLCEDSCPFDHLHKPTVDKEPEPRSESIKRLALLLGATPVIIGAGIAVGLIVAPVLSRAHFTVRLAEQVALEKAEIVPKGSTEETRAHYETSTTYDQLMASGQRVKDKIRMGSGILGAFIGLVVCCKLLALSIQRRRTDYEPDRGDCYSCARCSDACSVGKVPGVPVGTMRVTPVVLKFQSQVAQK